MNDVQELWWKQARSDHALFVQLRRAGVNECHLLHYLQMATEKLSKAYLWRSGHAPPRTHTGFVRFLRALLDRRTPELDRIATVLRFRRRGDLENWVRSVHALAYSLQNIAPAEAGNGPNPEYPWPHEAPAQCPIGHTFALWNQLTNTGQGRKLLEFVDHAVASFDNYA
jgi:hypothetical protein